MVVWGWPCSNVFMTERDYAGRAQRKSTVDLMVSDRLQGELCEKHGFRTMHAIFHPNI